MEKTKSQSPDTLEWILSGERGAVNFLVHLPDDKFTTPACVIGFHGRRRIPLGSDKTVRCDILPEGRCWQDVTWQRASRLWVSSACGTKDQPIWTELEDWYESKFGALK